MPPRKNERRRPIEGRRPLADPKATAVYLGLAETTGEQQLNRSRCEGTGAFADLPFYRLGRRIRYDLDEVDRWLSERHHVAKAPDPDEVDRDKRRRVGSA